LLSQGQVVIADGASFQGAQSVIVGILGQINIGTGGLAGTFNAPAITNSGVINFNFTDTTAMNAQVSGSGQIVKDGSGTVILTRNNTYFDATTIKPGNAPARKRRLGPEASPGTSSTTESWPSMAATFSSLAESSADTGSVQQNGTGTTVLVQDNTYTGATTVNVTLDRGWIDCERANPG